MNSVKRRSLGLGIVMAAGAMALAACSSGGGGKQSSEYGELALPLVTQGSSGTEYRLRDAAFEVRSTGYYYWDYSSAAGAGGESSTSLQLSSEDDPTAPNISVSVERGYYQVALKAGWRLEKVENGVATDVTATLISDANQYVWVNPHSTSFVTYQFGLGDRKIWFNGKLNVNLEVYESPDEYYGGGGAGFGGEGGAGPDIDEGWGGCGSCDNAGGFGG